MTNIFLENQVRYVMDATGEATEVLVPIALWQKLLQTLQDPDSGKLLKQYTGE